MRDRLGTLLYLFYLFEVGLFLLVVPWSALWEGNYFALQLAWVGAVCRNPYARGAISGLGLLHLVAAVRDSRAFIRSERARR